MDAKPKIKISSDDTTQKLSSKLTALDLEKKEKDTEEKAKELGLE